MAAIWQYRNDDGKFANFTKKDSTVLEKEWAKDSSSVLLVIRGHPYTIDLTHLTQTNDETKTQRLIRRVDADAAKHHHKAIDYTKKVPVWEWHSGHDTFTPFDHETNRTIEEAFHKDALHVTVSLQVSAHETHQFRIHFVHMTQERVVEGKGSGVARKVRRIMRLPTPPPPTAAAVADDSDLSSRAALLASKAATPPAAVAPTPAAADSKKRPRDDSAAPSMGNKHTLVEAASSGAHLSGVRLPTLSDWTVHASSVLILPPKGILPPASMPVRIAGFDMDDTLVFPHGGAVFAKNRGDWQWLCSAVVPVLKNLHDSGYLVTIFSNQSGIGGKGWDESKANEIRGKIVDLSAAAGIPISAYIATKEDEFRKPSPAMWDLCVASLAAVDATGSFYCGDAAGRTMMTMAGRKKDFSCSDRKFAYNVGLRFLTPEQIYPNQTSLPRPWQLPDGHYPEAFGWDGLGPAELAAVATVPPTVTISPKLELVIMVGFPGCGKSTFSKRYFAPHGYTIVNRDTLKTPAKCLQAAESSLSAKKSVVVDNTNPSSEARAPYIAMAKKFGASVRCFHFGHDAKLANHMNCIRARLGITARVSSIAYNMFKSQFEAPKGSEGIEEVIEIKPTADFTGLPPEIKTMFFQLS